MLDTHKIKAEAIGLCDDTKLWYYKCENNNFDNNSNIYTDKASFTESMKIKYNYLYTNSSTLSMNFSSYATNDLFEKS